MKIFTGKEEPSKSWSLLLRRRGDSVGLVAVDSISGKELTEILRFYDSGTIYNITCVQRSLSMLGYEPAEHDNSFNVRGQIEIYNMMEV